MSVLDVLADRLWASLGVLPVRDDTSAYAAQRPDPVIARDDLRQLEEAETARVLSGRRPSGPDPLPDDVPLRPSFLPDTQPVRCLGCDTVWSSDLNLARCWSCGCAVA